MIALDTETVGIDLYHGSKPFFVTLCDEKEEQTYWEWDVDPLTRRPQIPTKDIDHIRSILAFGPQVIIQNAKYDVTVMETIGISNWKWRRTFCTLIAGHLLASHHRHDLTAMALEYLGVDIEPYEKTLQDVCNKARRMARSKFPTWKIAKKGQEDQPSTKDNMWKADMWLPRAIARHYGWGEGHENFHWHTVLRDYSNADSAITIKLWQVMEKELKEKGLWEIYLERMKLLPIACKIEAKGVTVSKERLHHLKAEYSDESERLGAVMVNIAADAGYPLQLPKGSTPNNSLRKCCFDVLRLPPIRHKKAKTEAPSLDAKALEYYSLTLPRRSKALFFVDALRDKRKRDTAITYMESYERYWVPLGKFNGKGEQLWFLLHPTLNPTGTATLRWSSTNPNEQNISKKEGFNLRYCFGPEPGREWWSLDGKNLELRIPAFKADEKDLIWIFEHPEEGPYYGSYHLVVFDLLHPAEFKKHGIKCKEVYESTLYQWVKNGNFAVIYGAQEETADATYHVRGAYQKVRNRFPRIAQLADRMIAHANRFGYVETVPDRSLGCKRGYPLWCSRGNWGGISPTLPLNYYVQGTACWWMGRAMVRVQEQLDKWMSMGYDGWIVMQVHDELVLDLPRKGDPTKDSGLFRTSNLGKIRMVQAEMEKCGQDIGVPTPVSAEYHIDNWSTGIAL